MKSSAGFALSDHNTTTLQTDGQTTRLWHKRDMQDQTAQDQDQRPRPQGSMLKTMTKT